MRRFILVALVLPVTVKAATTDPPPATKGTVYVIGDSISNGAYATAGWPTILGYTKLSVNGSSLTRTLNGGNPNPWIADQFSGVPQNADTLIIAGGINDINFGASVADTAIAMTAYELRARRWGVKNVLFVTPTAWGAGIEFFFPGQLTTFQAKRAELNDWMRQLWGDRGQLVDCGDATGSPLLSGSYDVGDGLHLNDAGQNALAACIGPAVNSLTL